MKRCFAILLFVLSLPVLRAQVVSDVSFTLRNDSLAIRYTLDRRADICVRVSVGGGRYTEPLKGLTGAVGKGVEPGTGLTIEAIPANSRKQYKTRFFINLRIHKYRDKYVPHPHSRARSPL